MEVEKIADCKSALAGLTAFDVDFASIDVLPGVPVVAALAVRQGTVEDVHAKICGDADWTPCVELLRDPMVNMGWVRSAMREMFQPFTAKVVRIELMDGQTVVDALELAGEQA